jgi:hypothetical protein
MTALVCDRSQRRHYGDGERRYYSVSQVIDVLVGPRSYPPDAAQRGTDVHLICELELHRRYHGGPAPTIPAEYAGYHRSFCGWLDRAELDPLDIEQPRAHASFPYAGTPDLVAVLAGALTVIDLKSGGPSPWHAVQLQAYMRMVDRAARGLILYLDRDGGAPKTRIVRARSADWSAFVCALGILQWREFMNG